MVVTAWLWPTTLLKSCGRYFRYRDILKSQKIEFGLELYIIIMKFGNLFIPVMLILF